MGESLEGTEPGSDILLAAHCSDKEEDREIETREKMSYTSKREPVSVLVYYTRREIMITT